MRVELSNNNVKDINNLLNQINITNNKIKNQKVIDELNKKIYHIYNLGFYRITCNKLVTREIKQKIG